VSKDQRMPFDSDTAIKIGPRGKRSGRKEEIDIDIMVKAAQIYTLIALDICSRSRV
jgi:hypothetical protein